MALSTCTKCGEQPIGCGCESPYTTAPACLPVDPCSNPEPCSEFFDAECIIYSGDSIWCGTDQVVIKNDRLGTSIVNIVTYFCTQIATINTSLTTINTTLVSLQNQINDLGCTPFNLLGTSTDAGDNKTSDISRSGRLVIEQDSENRAFFQKNGYNIVGNEQTFTGLATASDTQNPLIELTRWRGTYFSPTNLLENDNLGLLSFKTGVSTYTGIFLRGFATENHIDDTNYGAGFEFWGIKKATSNARKILSIDADTGLKTLSETVDIGNSIKTFGSGLKPFIEFENTSGTEFSKGYLSNNDILGLISAKSKAGELGKALFIATQNHTVTNGGTKFEIFVTPNNSILEVPSLKIDQDGSVGFRNYTFPSADGTLNQILKTDGAGNLSWQNEGSSGSGTNNYVARWTPNDTTLGKGVIRDDGTTASIGIAPNASASLYISSSSNHGITSTTTGPGYSGGTFASSGLTPTSANIAVRGNAYGSDAINIGAEFKANVTAATDNIGIRVYADNAVNNYALQLSDGSEVAGRFLKCIDANGKANWADLPSVNLQKEITATYVLTDADNDYVIFINNGATAITISIGAITIPNFSVGFIQEGTGDVTFIGATNPVGLKSKGQGYQTFIERKLSTSTYYLLGNTKV